MKVGDVFEESFVSISSNLVRSGLTVLGIVIGIASVIALLAVGQGSTNSITASIESIGANLLVVTPGFQRAAGPVSAGRGSARTLTLTDAEDITTLNNVAAVAPELDGRYQVVATAGNTNVSVIATTSILHRSAQHPDRPRATSSPTRMSRTPTEWRSSGPRPPPISLAILRKEDKTRSGQTIRIKGLAFTVVGVTKSQKGEPASTARMTPSTCL